MGERLNLAGWILIGLAMLGFAAMMEFRLDFADGRHDQFDPPIVSETITIHVK